MAADDNPVREDYWTDHGLSPRGSSRTLQGESADFEAVVRHYGEAMLRLGRLEACAELDQVSNNGQGDVMERVAALEPLVGRSLSSTEDGVSPAGRAAADEVRLQYDDEVRQLRLINGNLSHRVARTETLLQEIRGGTSHRERQRPLWKRIARRVGLR